MSDKKNDPAADVRILIVDDELDHAETMAESLERVGYDCQPVSDGEKARKLIADSGEFDLVLTDLVMDEVSGLEILRAAKSFDPTIEVLVITGHGSIESAVEAMREGATAYLQKPINIEELRAVVERSAEKRLLSKKNLELHRQLDKRFGFEGIIGNSEQMQRIFDVLGQISRTNATVLILGESGTGKELIAKSLHNNSPRRLGNFVALNCAALSEGILESELFGHEKGAFTGALSRKIGRIEHADHGTLFLDEVGDMPMSTQVKLLRVIEEREIYRVGSNTPIPVDVRLVAATNRNLEKAVEDGRFREDLYYRLKVVTIELPPLRERQGDLPLLIDTFVREFAETHQRPIEQMSAEARKVLQEYAWPGNVRELRNCIENMIVIDRDGVLGVDDVPPNVSQAPQTTRREQTPQLAGRPLSDIERDAIAATLALVDGNRERASKMLGIGERTLYRKIKEYEL
ncbi:MAG: sigma-54 dependent transcriptional regulator [Planctomycetota bacterium]